MSVAKIDFKRELRRLYAPGRDPSLVNVPELAFLTIDGHGDPNTSTAFSDAITALFSVSYTLKFALKRAPGGIDYSVMPLEALWWGAGPSAFATAPKSTWSWTAMIMQPDEVTEDLLAEAIDAARRKRDLPSADTLRLERLREGLSAQLMHIGPYAEELPSIEKLHAFIAAQGYVPTGKHHEIYLGDPRRCAPAKLRTIIRQAVAGALS